MDNGEEWKTIWGSLQQNDILGQKVKVQPVAYLSLLLPDIIFHLHSGTILCCSGLHFCQRRLKNPYKTYYQLKIVYHAYNMFSHV